jgi:hypothetical protein
MGDTTARSAEKEETGVPRHVFARSPLLMASVFDRDLIL